MSGVLALTYSHDIVFQALVEGLVYSLVAMGLVLVFKATGVINFAHGQVGAFGAYAMALLYANFDIAYGISLPFAIVAGGAMGALIELLVVRRLFTQPRLLLFIATLGVSQVILVFQIRLPEIETFLAWPEPIKSEWDLPGGITLRGAQLLVLIVAPVIMVVFTWLMQRTRFGLSIRAAADNPNAASLAGISIRSVSTQVWVLAGVLSTVSVLLIGPIQHLDAGGIQTMGPKLLLLSLAAAMFGRLSSFSGAVVGGLVVGVIDRMLLANTETFGSGANLVGLFVLVLVLVLVRGRAEAGDEQAWALSPKIRALHADLARHWATRTARWLGSGFLVVLGLAMPYFIDAKSDYMRFSQVLLMFIVALSATVLTGWAGQLSLGQFGFVALGAAMTAYYAQALSYPVSLGLGVLWGAGAAVLMGIPALRIRGIYLAIVTLGFALVCQTWLFTVERISTHSTGAGFKLNPIPEIGPYSIFGLDLGPWDMRKDKQALYYACLGFVLVSLLVVTRIRRTGIGRSLIAVRENQNSAAAYTVSPTRAKLIAFGVSGALAALAGGLLLMTTATGGINTDMVQPEESLKVIAIAVVGGISSITGAVLGTLLVVALPELLDGTDQVKLFTSGLGMMIIILYFPGGLVSIAQNVRDLLVNRIIKRTNWTPPAKEHTESVGSLSAREPSASTEMPLMAEHVSVSFGGRPAVADVSVNVQPGEVVGLIGTNGAGKTTFMNAVSGFVPAEGTIEVFGDRVDGLADYRRARHGVGRAFQNARLFGALTVRETLMVALEARERSLLLPSMTALPPSVFAERRKRSQADEIILYLGLGRYADSLLAELSTGTRRIVELGSLMALDTRLMLLDEPTAGVAQRETEAFGPLIRSIQAELDSSVLIIEHDMPMVMSISDRIYCLEAGQVIAEGTPDEVRHDPKVVASYLGTDERAIQRSDSQRSDA